MTREDRDGFSRLTFKGAVPKEFRQEVGVHRWQRVPPTENSGRVHTSTITVAIVSETESLTVDPSRFTIRRTRSRGNGGQNVNKRETAVIAHDPITGLEVRCEDNRTQGQNQEAAVRLLAEKINKIESRRAETNAADSLRKQVGSGSRSDSANRTVCVYGGEVRFASGSRMPFAKYMKGQHLR